MESYRAFLARARREYMIAAMRECGFIVARAAVAAGCNRTDFYKLLDKYAPHLPRRQTPVAERRGRNVYGERIARGGNSAWKALDSHGASG